jgi:hypothetical protein
VTRAPLVLVFSALLGSCRFGGGGVGGVEGGTALGFGDVLNISGEPMQLMVGGSGSAVLHLSLRDGYSIHPEDLKISANSSVPLILGEPEFADLPVAAAQPGPSSGIPDAAAGMGALGSFRTTTADADPEVALHGDISVRVPVEAGAAVPGLHAWELTAQVRVCSASGCRAIRAGRVPLLVSVVER